MEARNTRTAIQIIGTAIATDGSIKDFILPSEITLKIGILTANAVNKINANQKLGTHIPIIQIIRIKLSKIPLLLITEIAEKMTVNKTTHNIDIITIVQVTGIVSLYYLLPVSD